MRIKQFTVEQCISKPGKRAMPTGKKLAFFAHSPKECSAMLATWLGMVEKGWVLAKTRPSVRKGFVVWTVAQGVSVP